MGHLHSVYAQKTGQDEYGRDVEQSLPTDGEECGGEGVSDVLEQHAGGGAQGAEWEHDALPPQGAGTDGNQRGVFAAEQADDLRREDKPQHRQHGEHCGRDAEGVEIGAAHTPEMPCPIVETAHGLEALGKSQHQRIGKHGGARNHRKGRHSRSVHPVGGVACGSVVQQDGGGAVQCLPHERGQASRHYLAIAFPRWLEVGKTDMHRFAPTGSPQQQTPGKELAEGGGQRGTGDSHV